MTINLYIRAESAHRDSLLSCVTHPFCLFWPVRRGVPYVLITVTFLPAVILNLLVKKNKMETVKKAIEDDYLLTNNDLETRPEKMPMKISDDKIWEE